MVKDKAWIVLFYKGRAFISQITFDPRHIIDEFEITLKEFQRLYNDPLSYDPAEIEVIPYLGSITPFQAQLLRDYADEAAQRLRSYGFEPHYVQEAKSAQPGWGGFRYSRTYKGLLDVMLRNKFWCHWAMDDWNLQNLPKQIRKTVKYDFQSWDWIVTMDIKSGEVAVYKGLSAFISPWAGKTYFCNRLRENFQLHVLHWIGELPLKDSEPKGRWCDLAYAEIAKGSVADIPTLEALHQKARDLEARVIWAFERELAEEVKKLWDEQR